MPGEGGVLVSLQGHQQKIPSKTHPTRGSQSTCLAFLRGDLRGDFKNAAEDLQVLAGAAWADLFLEKPSFGSGQ